MKKIIILILWITSMITLFGCQQNGNKPVITGHSDINYSIGQDRPDLKSGVQALDDEDGDLTSMIVMDDTLVNWNVEGSYPVTYTVTDKDGHVVKVTIYVQVIAAENEILDIYYINDTHGAIEKNGNQLGLSYIGNLVMDAKQKNPNNTLFLGGGDLLQGNILSNYYYGASMIHALNKMGLDAFVLGNHEFDWGLDVVTNYFNEASTDLKADFPALGANIFRKDTMERPDFVDAYTIIEKGNIKVGVIGLMGYGLESSIATARIMPYVFDDPIIWAGHYAEHLRTNEDVDVVLAVIHGRSDYTNSQIAALSGNNKIDAIFNGHTHSRYTQTISRDGLDVPVIQSKANGEYVGRVSLTVSNGSVIDFSLTNLHPTQSSSTASDHITRDSRLATSQTEVQAIINEYKLAIDSLLNEVILTSSSYYSKNDLTNYMAALIRLSVNADIGIHNYGGTRTELSQNQAITVATLYEIFPFDNRVKYVYLSGSDIKDYANSYDALSFKDGLSLSTLKNDVYYKVATNDYIFDKLDNPFIHGVDPVDTGILIRDLLETVLREQAKYYSTFSMDRPIVLTPVSYHVTREEDIA